MQRKLLGACFVLALLAGCDQGEPKEVEVKLQNESGDEVGKATLSDQPGGLQIKIEAKGFKPGPHGFSYP
ncbi:hypothetical protein GCM10020331_029400 [Ectobacillus funiculus]